MTSETIYCLRFWYDVCSLIRCPCHFYPERCLIYYSFTVNVRAGSLAKCVGRTDGLNLSMVFKGWICAATATIYSIVRSELPIILAKPREDLSNISAWMAEDNRDVGSSTNRCEPDRVKLIKFSDLTITVLWSRFFCAIILIVRELRRKVSARISSVTLKFLCGHSIFSYSSER